MLFALLSAGTFIPTMDLANRMAPTWQLSHPLLRRCPIARWNLPARNYVLKPPNRRKQIEAACAKLLLVTRKTGATRMKLNFYLVGSALVAALGGLLFGFDTAVISGTTQWLQSEFRLTDFALGFTVASALIGTIIGSIAVGKPSDSIGRRGILFVLAVFYLISAIGCALAWSWGAFMVFRFLEGWVGAWLFRPWTSPRFRLRHTEDAWWHSPNSI
jgi:hypothetical protein